ncbi:insulin receptor substrate 1-B-like [Hydractinia symbiolongicarpus]|uniref:insulin receptor substrate 1-B-like n=1 Tax=Hydractinia symbiolongicarpus TaxID=13093 RepID=UPI00254DCD06|nr:insulin receptor substrate 1-B-like [Hydractinia symbiolongicarpus]
MVAQTGFATLISRFIFFLASFIVLLISSLVIGRINYHGHIDWLLLTMEVLHEGHLERCIHVSDTKKDWKKAYFVYKKHTRAGSKTLEFFKDSNWKRQEPKGVINLFAGYNVQIVDGSKKKFRFELTTVEKTYELYASSEGERQKWVDLLHDGLIVKTFNVVLIQSPPNAYSFIRDIHGSSQLQISESSVSLISTGAQSLTWKFSTIRRYKSHNGAFVLEVGRKAQTGEGEFKFDTVNPAELFDVLDKAVKDRSKAKGVSDTTPLKALPSALESRKPLAPPMQPSASIVRRPSDKAPTVPPPPPPDKNEYSHIHSTSQKSPTNQPTDNGDYHKLFAHDRLVKHRNSEPTISTRVDKSKQVNSSISPVEESDELYMDMSASNEELQRGETQAAPSPKPRPNPPPRVRPNDFGSPLAKPLTKIPLSKTKSTPSDENTYDTPLSPNRSQSTKVMAKTEYDHLFNQKHVVSDQSDYSHLSRNTGSSCTNVSSDFRQPAASPVTDDNFYDSPKSAIPAIQPSPKKTPVKPARSAPMAPSHTNFKDSRKGYSPVTPGGNVILKLTRNNSIADSQPVYDSPSRQVDAEQEIEGYNKVGDIIPGEYHRSTDADGYVRVPSDSLDDESGGIYQVPRGEKSG